MKGESEVNVTGNTPIISISFEDVDNVSQTSVSITVSANSSKEAYKTLEKVVDNIISNKLVSIRNKQRR